MSKPKRTDGMLCNDKAEDGGVIFYPGCARSAIVLSRLPGWKGIWLWKSHNPDTWGTPQEWTREEWRENYDIDPPAPGKCYEVELEL